MWLNMSVVTLNATLQFLVIYRLVDLSNWVSSTRKISLRRVRIMRIMIKNNYNEQTMS